MFRSRSPSAKRRIFAAELGALYDLRAEVGGKIRRMQDLHRRLQAEIAAFEALADGIELQPRSGGIVGDFSDLMKQATPLKANSISGVVYDTGPCGPDPRVLGFGRAL